MDNKQDKGFTLVELLIVIVILGILATVTVFAVRGITTRGQENACGVEKRTIETGAEAYFAQEGEVAASLTVLVDEGYLKEDPSARWVFDAGDATTAATVEGTGDCLNWYAA